LFMCFAPVDCGRLYPRNTGAPASCTPTFSAGSKDLLGITNYLHEI
jgi:hypothetical protein